MNRKGSCKQENKTRHITLIFDLDLLCTRMIKYMLTISTSQQLLSNVYIIIYKLYS